MRVNKNEPGQYNLLLLDWSGKHGLTLILHKTIQYPNNLKESYILIPERHTFTKNKRSLKARNMS